MIQINNSDESTLNLTGVKLAGPNQLVMGEGEFDCRPASSSG
jgi:hypothetical protein